MQYQYDQGVIRVIAVSPGYVQDDLKHVYIVGTLMTIYSMCIASHTKEVQLLSYKILLLGKV